MDSIYMPGKRIGFDARYINDRYHGIGRYAFQLLKCMVALAPDINFYIYRGDASDKRFDWDELIGRPNTAIRQGPKPLYYPQEQLIWPYHLKRDRVDIFHTPYFNVPFFTGVPVIMTVHDLIFERFPQYMPDGWIRPYYTIMMKYGLMKARKIITVSQSTAEDLENFYTYSSEKLAIIQEGVDDNFTPVNDASSQVAMRKKYGLDSPYILSVGARRPHKNFGRLVKVFSRISSDFPHDLVLIGSTDNRFEDEVTLEIGKTELNARIKELEWVSEDDLASLYTLAEIVVLPSIIEGFGLPALEAMACGTPVIAADSSSFPDVINGAGILIDPYDMEQMESAMRQLLIDDEERMYLREAGLKRSAEFTWEKTAQAVLGIYDEIIS